MAQTSREDFHRVSRRRFLTDMAAGTAFLGATSLGCPWVRAQEETIRIGFPTPLTGPFGVEAKDQVRAAELAVRQFNEAGGLNGRKAELLVRDDKLNPGEAATRTLELIEKDRSNFIVGALSASVQLAVNAVTKPRGVIYVSISQSDAINEATDFSRFTFHEALNPHMTAGAVGRHVFKRGMRIAFLIADYAYGHEMERGFRRVAETMGAEVVGDLRHPFGAADYSTFLPRITSMKPDVLCVCNFGRDQANSLKQINDFGMKKQMRVVVPVILYNQRLAAGPAVFEGVLGGSNYYWGLEQTVPSAKEFNDAFRAAYNRAVPSDYAAYGYAGVRVLLEGIRRAGTTDSEPVIDQLEQLRYDIYKGPEHFRKCDHQAVQSVLILESKKKAAMKGESDLFDIVANEPGDEANLRPCQELGHSG